MADDDLTDVDAAVAEARARFEHEFAAGCNRMFALLEHVALTHDRDALTAVIQVLHRMGGLGGTIGFPQVSSRAREFEDWILETPPGTLDMIEARERLRGLQRAFAEDGTG